MKLMRRVLSVAAVSLMCTMLLFTASAAPAEQSSITALRGVDAQPMTAAEMKAVSGELNAYDISAALTKLAAEEAKFPKVQAATLKLAQYFSANAAQINANFAKYGLLTPCKSCS